MNVIWDMTGPLLLLELLLRRHQQMQAVHTSPMASAHPSQRSAAWWRRWRTPCGKPDQPVCSEPWCVQVVAARIVALTRHQMQRPYHRPSGLLSEQYARSSPDALPLFSRVMASRAATVGDSVVGAVGLVGAWLGAKVGARVGAGVGCGTGGRRPGCSLSWNCCCGGGSGGGRDAASAGGGLGSGGGGSGGCSSSLAAVGSAVGAAVGAGVARNSFGGAAGDGVWGGGIGCGGGEVNKCMAGGVLGAMDSGGGGGGAAIRAGSSGSPGR